MDNGAGAVPQLSARQRFRQKAEHSTAAARATRQQEIQAAVVTRNKFRNKSEENNAISRARAARQVVVDTAMRLSPMKRWSPSARRTRSSSFGQNRLSPVKDIVKAAGRLSPVKGVGRLSPVKRGASKSPKAARPPPLVDPPSGEAVFGAAARRAAAAVGAGLVVPAGARISVYWEGGEEWYESTVVAHQAVYDHTGAIVAFKHKCEYENGIISHDLSESEYEVLEWPEGHGPHDEPFGEEAEEEEEEEADSSPLMQRFRGAGTANNNNNNVSYGQYNLRPRVSKLDTAQVLDATELDEISVEQVLSARVHDRKGKGKEKKGKGGVVKAIKRAVRWMRGGKRKNNKNIMLYA